MRYSTRAWASALRWVVIAEFVDSLLPLLAAQVLHAASFGLYHAVAISLINRFFTGHHQGRGQAIYPSLSFGGQAVGSFGAGVLWGAFGGAVAVAAIGLRDVND